MAIQQAGQYHKERVGAWVCLRDMSRLRNSLEIAVHLGRLKSQAVSVSEGRDCTKDHIVFDCDKHGHEEA